MQVLLFSSSLGHNSALTEGTLVPWGGTYLGIEVSLPEYTTQFAFSTSHLTTPHTLGAIAGRAGLLPAHWQECHFYQYRV